MNTTAHTRKSGPGRHHAEPKTDDRRRDKTELIQDKAARAYLTRYASARGMLTKKFKGFRKVLKYSVVKGMVCWVKVK